MNGSPWRMPLTLMRFEVVFDQPWPVEERLAHNIVTTLRGALDRDLLDAHCTRADCAPHRPCPVPGCIAAALTKPSTNHGKPRDHPPSLGLDVDGHGLTRTVLLTLWGRRAGALAAEAEASLRRAAEGRVRAGGQTVRVSVGECERLQLSLGEWVRLAPPPKGPVFTRHRVVVPRTTGPEDLGYLAKNVAHDLVQWDLADSGAAAVMKSRDVDDAGDHARNAALTAFSGLRSKVLRTSRFRDERVSDSNGGTHAINAAEVELELTGEIEPAWPWLRAMSLRGPGSRLSLGISYLSIFVAGQATDQ